MTIAGDAMTDLRVTEDAMKLALLIERADGARRTGQSLGFAQINYGRLFVRDYWTLFAIARELDCEIADIAPRDNRAEKRQKWDELVRNSEALLLVIRTLPAPLRFLAEARATNESWKKIQRRSPGRLAWSMRDDYARAIELITLRAPDAIALLASSENILLSRGARERMLTAG